MRRRKLDDNCIVDVVLNRRTKGDAFRLKNDEYTENRRRLREELMLTLKCNRKQFAKENEIYLYDVHFAS